MNAISNTTAAARIAVIDLTAQLGVSALQKLMPGLSSTGPWMGVELAGMPGRACLDWYRPTSDSQLPAASDLPLLGCYVIAGPGAVARLPDALGFMGRSKPQMACVLLAPNAVIESIELQRVPSWPGLPHPPRLLELPTSDPQALWLILLEQIESLLMAHGSAFLETSFTGELDVSSNLKHSMDLAMGIDGALAVALVDHRSGMCLAQAGGGMNLDVAAAGNTEVVRAKLRTMESLGIKHSIEDILITLHSQYHLIRLIPNNPGLFLYLVLDRQRGNLALARYRLTDIERALKV